MTNPRLLVPLHLLPPVSGAPVAYSKDLIATCLDLSPPDVVDGVPVRLDALGWALDVLDAWYGDDPLPLDDVEPLAPGETLDAGRRRVVADLLRKGRPGVRS